MKGKGDSGIEMAGGWEFVIGFLQILVGTL